MTIEEKLLLNDKLETDRLKLRPVTLDDASDMYAYAQDPETVKYVFDQHQSVEATKSIILSYFMKTPMGKWGIELKQTHHLIGTIDMRVDQANLRAEIGYAIGRSYWGNGYVPEAATRILELGFAELHLKRIQARHIAENYKSGRVMQKIGMHQEGIFKNYAQHKGQTVDEIYYAITDAEWQNLEQAFSL
ncbi:GNAT family N-acetyltransferase [Pediococcus siamensis]|uniref:GNAT family N-acetyltransferase n=1 Tax=Pediococcus siamensis TaxID=381829 RepID=UPI0039A251A0